MEANPLSVILVLLHHSKGDRLLFRYPFHEEVSSSELNKQWKRKNPYSANVNEDILQNSLPQTSNICKGRLTGFPDELLSTLFAVKSELCNQKFELKVNDVRFVSHPTLMQSTKDDQKSFILINIVFALQAQANYSIVKCYYELSKRLGIGLVYEENRVNYLSEEMKMMVKTHDESAVIIEQGNNTITAFDLILERSTLAQCLKTLYHDLCSTGLLNITINNWVTLSFCLPHKAHQFHKKGVVIDPETIDKCLQPLKPYYGMLLLVDPSELLDCIPPSGAKILIQIIDAYNPLKSLQNMATDADLSLEHVYQLVSHLVYWAKATIIYPLCETNVYVIAPDACLQTNSPLVEKFSSKFPGMSLFEVISDFSLPTSIGHLTTPLQHPARQGRLAQMVLWMLQHHLLMQLHTYVQFMPLNSDFPSEEYGDSEEGTSTPNLSLNFQSNNLKNISSSPMPVPNKSCDLEQNLSNNLISLSHTSNYSNIHSDSLSTENGESLISVEDEDKIKELLACFPERDRSAVSRVRAASNTEDLSLLLKLWQMGYFKGEHHLEEIMYFENLRRSQLLQLLDKFRDILIIYETEDPAIASLYTKA